MSQAVRAYPTSGAQSAHVESLTRGASGDVPCVMTIGGGMDFGGTAAGTLFDAVDATSGANARSAERLCRGYERIVLKAEFEKAAGHVTIRVWLKDANGTPGWTCHASRRINSNEATGAGFAATLKSSYYHAPVETFETYGASYFLVEATAGNGKRSMWWAAR